MLHNLQLIRLHVQIHSKCEVLRRRKVDKTYASKNGQNKDWGKRLRNDKDREKMVQVRGEEMLGKEGEEILKGKRSEQNTFKGGNINPGNA